MWCDDFDLDLLKIVPEAIAVLARVPPALVLRTFGQLTGGRLNHPAVWHTPHGMTAHFTLGLGRPAPLHCVSLHAVVACTFTEAVRDAWLHNFRIVVDGSEVWDGATVYHRWFQPLMYHHRGWLFLEPLRLRRVEQQVCTSLAGAVRRLELVAARRPPVHTVSNNGETPCL